MDLFDSFDVQENCIVSPGQVVIHLQNTNFFEENPNGDGIGFSNLLVLHCGEITAQNLSLFSIVNKTCRGPNCLLEELRLQGDLHAKTSRNHNRKRVPVMYCGA